MSEARPRLRLDKWLFHARFFKTRSLSAKTVGEGAVRVNGARIDKPAHPVGPGDVLTFSQGRAVRVVRIESLGVRRGPAEEARALYTDLSEPPPAAPDNPAFEGKGRPTGKQRRQFDLSRRQTLE